jgi:two-component system sensor histidine kinase AlgZ
MVSANVAVVESTLRALAAPRRLVPVVLVAGVLVLVQAGYSRDLRAALVPLAMTAGFLLVAPAGWRSWLARSPRAPLGLAAFVASGVAVVALAGVLLPRALGLGPTFLGDAGSLAVALVLYLAGGWGLGRDIELELDLAHAQLVAVRTHLDPHFLYNTLNAIAEWCREDAVQAEQAILRLSAMLEGLFAGLEARAWPLARELALVEDLVALHRVRDPGALSLATRSEGDLADVQVPPLALLLLVENALKHGARKGHPGELRLSVAAGGRDARAVRITVSNPGPYRPGAPGRGLALLRQRLAAAYGPGAHVELAAHGERTHATLHLPRRTPR